ncbi:MAG: 2'-5' RNA ligase family protein [Oscillospiraceae bacterium]|nr:2'-5' RNA ligase family protein [Oscillospiraceae bacterium]
MDYALELFFDEQSEQRIRDDWRQVGNDYLLRVQSTPHVTLGIFSDIPPAQADATLQAAAKRIAPFPMQFASVGAFVSPHMWLYLAPTVTQHLLDLHARLHDVFAFCDSAKFPYYHVGNWVPHCAITPAENAQQLARATEILAQAHEPFTAQVTRMAWVEITKPVKTMACYHLNEGEIT